MYTLFTVLKSATLVMIHKYGKEREAHDARDTKVLTTRF